MRGVLGLVAVAMVAFAGNSLLARAALAGGFVDAVSFTAIRLVSGAAALVVVLVGQRGVGVVRLRPGSWPSALALFAYALAFSTAYLRLGAATGALVLFASVQGAMVFWGLVRRQRLTGMEGLGLAVAFAAFVYLLLPGLDTPDLLGSVLMMSAGIAWGMYSLRGRAVRDPLGDTAGNFVRAALACLPLVFLPVVAGHVTGFGVGLAVISGVVTSGFGYAVWYRALPRLSTAQAATVQLTVPIIAATGAVVFLSEALTWRLVVASVCLLGGVALAIMSKAPAPARS